MMKKLKFYTVLTFIFYFLSSLSTSANPKLKIIENINNFESLKFNFSQLSNNIMEKGVCYLKRPHFLKCIYEDKKKKEIIVNKNSLVVFHKRYNKSYIYPAKKSYLIEILDKNKFSKLITSGYLNDNKDSFEIELNNDKKGKIVFYFDKTKFDLLGWKVIDINANVTNFSINNLSKNLLIEKNFFDLPSLN
tara:strand:- start:579 stop:1151 length:573 start_codon:yes stop_codon:yes gene_type:complete